MTLVRNNPANFGNLFNELITNFPNSWGKDEQSTAYIPPANIHETKDGYHIDISAPGRNKENFTIHQEKGLLTIGFEKKTDTEKSNLTTIRKEFSFNSFKRSFHLDEKINTQGILAKYEDGVLKVFLPKKEELFTTPQQITIQ